MSFTYEYSQPEEYRFSLDSIQAPQFIARALALQKPSDLSQWKVLDLCAGCGVMGFELSYHLPALRHLHFVEVQSVYLEHFKKNVQTVARPEVEFEFHLKNYADLRTPELKANFDLIIVNPPYFRSDQGKLSPSDFKNRCRFFIDSDFAQLIESILWLRKPEASCFVLLRDLKDHSRSIFQELEQMIDGRAKFRKVADVRGTDLVEIF